MIDEKKIVSASIDCAVKFFYEEDEEPPFNQLLDAFEDGVNWFLDNLWHDVKEEPEPNKPLLVQYAKHGETYFTSIEYVPSNGITWHDLVIEDGITKWCYIDDLLKGGKE